MSEIPEKYQNFCKDIARLAGQYDLSKFGITFTPGFVDFPEWTSDIQCNWNWGRHGDSGHKLYITSTIMLHTEIKE